MDICDKISQKLKTTLFLSLSLSGENSFEFIFTDYISIYLYRRLKRKDATGRGETMIYCGVQPEYLEKEKRKKNRADLASGKKKLIAQQTDRGKRHHKCNILSKLIFGIMLYKNAAPFNPVLLL